MTRFMYNALLLFERKSWIDIDIDIEDLFTVEYYKPFNISSVALFHRQTYFDKIME